MRVKMDFVTNSSSSSFCAWGVSLVPHELMDNDVFMDALYKTTDMKMSFDEYRKEIEDDWYAVQEDLEKLLENTLLQVSPGPDSDYMFVGIHPTSIPEDMTIREAKEIMAEKLALIGIHEKIDWIEESWYN